MDQQHSHLRRCGLLLGAALLSGCTVNDGDSFEDLEGVCTLEWSYEGDPEPECEAKLFAQIGLDPVTWDGPERDLYHIVRGLWAFARAPIDLSDREYRYTTVVSGIETTSFGRTATDGRGHVWLDVQSDVAPAACAIIHEGRHSTYGPHDIDGKIDIGMDGPHGWCVRFAESFAKLGVDYGSAAYTAERRRLYIR